MKSRFYLIGWICSLGNVAIAIANLNFHSAFGWLVAAIGWHEISKERE